MPLLAATDFEDLPSDEIDRWLRLRELLEHRVDESEDHQNGYSRATLLEYTQLINAIATELGLGTIAEAPTGNIHEVIDDFRAEVAAVAARFSLRANKRKLASAASVTLSGDVKVRLSEEIAKLRIFVHEAELTEQKKSKILNRLDDLQKEIDEDRVRLKSVMTALALCAAGIGGTTSFLADAPEAAQTIANVSQLVGLQKLANEEKAEVLKLPSEPAVPSLPAPPKQLPKPE
ncbi:hypothetical protein TRL7639_03755 [Falsiruegeria litorea R37]|uniref:Uncharacterized protein n=1 Tax=Falsiruegeria litorea R37 TaxID=1200284 RepID=A0A1Y5TL71_9RHOB|nr:hypothetical protein [Falsiruegeria litorea]SLN66172.1 hypothetical protein TRL7639_03755 [Falsiruegeria litorea R37]